MDNIIYYIYYLHMSHSNAPPVINIEYKRQYDDDFDAHLEEVKQLNFHIQHLSQKIAKLMIDRLKLCQELKRYQDLYVESMTYIKQLNSRVQQDLELPDPHSPTL